MNEDVNLTIAKISAALGIVCAASGGDWRGQQGELVECAVKYLQEVLAIPK